jgi:eukaryotic-like serine/threonine-protein kinase
MSEQSPAEAIFFAALERSTPAERAAYLDGACAGDSGLRRRVQRLLAAHEQAGNFLERPVQEAAGLHELTPRLLPARRPKDGMALDFLTPSGRPGSLGRLGHYEVLEVLGRGGMGVVLRAFDEKLRRAVALKVMAPHLAGSASARDRFVREGRALAAVSHDNVLAVHAVEDAGPVPFLVMPFIDGQTLQAKLKPGAPLPVAEVVRVGREVAAGLAAAHARGLVHRDVKPTNILLESGSGRVKVSDFGLARGAGDTSLTHSGLIVGTPEYMSPEQAAGTKVDHRSDLFSLGTVLYTLCAGRSPFRAETTLAVLRRVCEDTPRPLREINPEIPAWLEAVIARLHAKAPAERLQTAAEVAEALGRHRTPPKRTDVARRVAKVPGRQVRRKRALRAALVALLLLGVIMAAGVVAYHLSRRADQAGPPLQAAAPGGSDDTAREPAPAPQPAPAPEPAPPPPAEEWTKRRSPLDALKPQAMGLPENAPPGLLALLGQPAAFPLNPWANSHWMAQSADGRLLAVPSGSSVLLFEARDGSLVRTLKPGGPIVPEVVEQAYRPAFSPDGKRLAAGYTKGHVSVWEVATGQERYKITGHSQPVWCVAFDAQSRRLVTADAGGAVKVWVGNQPQTSLTGHAKGVNQIAFSPDGKRLATASLDGTCKVWEPDTGRELRSLTGDVKTFGAVAWSGDGRLLAAGDDAGAVVWDADDYKVKQTLKARAKGLLAFSPDGKTLWTAQHDCTSGQLHAFSRWDLKTGALLKNRNLPTLGGFAHFLLGADGATVFVTEQQTLDSRVRAYDAETGKERFPRRGHTGAVRCLAFSPDGRTLATGSTDTTVRLWDLAGWKSGEPEPPFRTPLPIHHAGVWSLAFSPDGKTLASTSTMTGFRERQVILRDMTDGGRVHDLNDQEGIASLVAFSPDGSTLFAGSENRVNQWDVRTGKKEQLPAWNDGMVQTVALSPDGRLMACGDTHTIQMIDRQAGKRLPPFRGEKAFINLAFSPDGKTLAATTDSMAPLLRMWDVASGQEQPARAGHTWDIFGLSFHPGGRLVATAGWDSTVRLWDVAPPGKEVGKFDLRAGRAFCVAFSPEGRHLAVGMENGTVAILRVAP